MLKLHNRFQNTWDAEPFVARIATSSQEGDVDSPNTALLISGNECSLPPGCCVLLKAATVPSDGSSFPAIPIISLPESMDYLAGGDIVRVSPRAGELWVMYRRNSGFNSILLTEQCNSNCIMCSQPPKDRPDRHLLESYLQAIPLMSPETKELGISGGEPTLLGHDFLRVISACRDFLPDTALHVLSNGRMFNYLSLARAVSELDHPDLMFGIPVYSDIASEHDFVVQSAGAFTQTIRGIMNLERCGVRVEIRIVLHRNTIEGLPSLARFIARNLPFVDHIALMGLEMMGYVKMNLEAVWIDPIDYQQQLSEAVDTLVQHGLNTSIYNHQLCVLPEELWPWARKSISDWKNEYSEECEACSVKHDCGGFFSSAKLRKSRAITPIKSDSRQVVSDNQSPSLS